MRLELNILPDEFHKNLNIDRWMSWSLPPAAYEEDYGFAMFKDGFCIKFQWVTALSQSQFRSFLFIIKEG
jgi:hypothetical protein